MSLDGIEREKPKCNLGRVQLIELRKGRRARHVHAGHMVRVIMMLIRGKGDLTDH